jgi:hypothetical protein
MKIWDKKKEGVDNSEKELGIRKKIFEIKKNVKEKGGLDQIDTQGYLSKGHMNVIFESGKIIKDRAFHNNKTVLQGKTNSLYNFLIDNREISMKNFLLDLLKNERDKIETKEGEVSKALKGSEFKLEDDFKKFENFTEYEKKIQKENERVLLEKGKDNRELADRKKKLNQENKQICDELERTVKSIRNYKGDAIFVHYVLGDTRSIKFKNDINILEMKNFDYNEERQKDTDTEKITEDLM